jgi:hypothetical protein
LNHHYPDVSRASSPLDHGTERAKRQGRGRQSTERFSVCLSRRPLPPPRQCPRWESNPQSHRPLKPVALPVCVPGRSSCGPRSRTWHAGVMSPGRALARPQRSQGSDSNRRRTAYETVLEPASSPPCETVTEVGVEPTKSPGSEPGRFAGLRTRSSAARGGVEPALACSRDRRPHRKPNEPIVRQRRFPNGVRNSKITVPDPVRKPPLSVPDGI